jgi:hypothetical protein
VRARSAAPDELGERALDCRWRLLRLAKEQRGRALGTSAFLLEPALNGRADWRRNADLSGRLLARSGASTASSRRAGWSPMRSRDARRWDPDSDRGGPAGRLCEDVIVLSEWPPLGACPQLNSRQRDARPIACMIG